MREEGLSMAEEIEWSVGIDWASQSHQVCLVDARGECLGERAVAHGGPGIEELCSASRTSVAPCSGRGEVARSIHAVASSRLGPGRES